MKRIAFVLILILMFSGPVFAEVSGEVVEYQDGETVLEGYLVYDDDLQGQQPGIIVVHDWMGPGEYGNWRSDLLAEMGYVVLAVDIYGKGVRPQNNEEAAVQSAKYKNDLILMRSRARAGFDLLKDHPLVDEGKTAAIGYCFGGTVVLEMARSGLDLTGVVSFHGGLSTSMPAGPDDIKAKVLALHGADDPHVPPLEVAQFQKEMNQAGVDWQMVYYSGAVHAFTKKKAGNDPSKGAAYNKDADRRSWQDMKQFFEEIFE